MAAGHEHVAMFYATLIQPMIGAIHGCGIAVFVGKHVKVRQAAANEHAACIQHGFFFIGQNIFVILKVFLVGTAEQTEGRKQCIGFRHDPQGAGRNTAPGGASHCSVLRIRIRVVVTFDEGNDIGNQISFALLTIHGHQDGRDRLARFDQVVKNVVGQSALEPGGVIGASTGNQVQYGMR